MANNRPWLTPYAFQPGQSGNPAGRAKDHGIVAMVRRRCGVHGAKLIEGLYVLAFGAPAERRVFFGEKVNVSAKDRRECMETLIERGPLLVRQPGPPRLVSERSLERRQQPALFAWRSTMLMSMSV